MLTYLPLECTYIQKYKVDVYEASFWILLKQNSLKTRYWCTHPHGVLHVDIAKRTEEDRDYGGKKKEEGTIE